MDILKRNEDMNCWFKHFDKRPAAKVRLLCFHSAGGSPSAFRAWGEMLPSYVQLVCASLPGRESRFRHPLMKDLSEVVGILADLTIAYDDIPTVFFGHSLGAWIAYQLALSLRENASGLPAHIIVSGRSAPGDPTEYYKKISHLPDDEFLEAIRNYGGTPEDVVENQDLREIYLPILRADFMLSESAPIRTGRVSCPISVFSGQEDRMSEEQLRLWSGESTGQCRVSIFPGDHFFINSCKSEVIKEIVRVLDSVINRRSCSVAV